MSLLELIFLRVFSFSLMISTIIQVLPMPSDYGKVHPPSFLLTLLSAYTFYIIVVIKVTQVCKTAYCNKFFLFQIFIQYSQHFYVKTTKAK